MMTTERRSRVVLVVDDDPTIRLILMLNLEAEGMHVELANDGEEGLQLALQLKPDVVVLDVMMPRRNGFDVLRALRGDPATTDLPVVLLSARTSDDAIWEGWRSGADSYVTKPFDLGDLIQLLEQMCTGRRRGADPGS